MTPFITPSDKGGDTIGARPADRACALRAELVPVSGKAASPSRKKAEQAHKRFMFLLALGSMLGPDGEELRNDRAHQRRLRKAQDELNEHIAAWRASP